LNCLFHLVAVLLGRFLFESLEFLAQPEAVSLQLFELLQQRFLQDFVFGVGFVQTLLEQLQYAGGDGGVLGFLFFQGIALFDQGLVHGRVLDG